MSQKKKRILLRLAAIFCTLCCWFAPWILIIFARGKGNNLAAYGYLIMLFTLISTVGGARIAYLLTDDTGLALVSFFFPFIVLPVLVFKDIFKKSEAASQEVSVMNRATVNPPVHSFEGGKHSVPRPVSIANRSKNTKLGKIEKLLNELLIIGQTDGYLSMTPGGKFNENSRNIRAIEIGTRLDEMGGMETMRMTGMAIRQFLGGTKGRELEVCWDGIGNWHG